MCALLAACQKPEPVSFQEPAQIEASSTQTLDLTDLCQKIDKNMSEIDAQRTTFALEQINQDLKLCLPLLGFQQQKHLLGLSNKMYHDFLSVERTPQQQRAFESYALEMAQHPTIQQSLLSNSPFATNTSSNTKGSLMSSCLMQAKDKCITAVALSI